MTSDDDRRLAALEQRLARRAPRAPSSSMRSRILTSVEAALSAPAVGPVRDDMRLALTACSAVALTLGMLMLTVSWQSVPADRGHGISPIPLSLIDRAAAVGITVETSPPSLMAAYPLRRRPVTDGDKNRLPMERFRLLEGDL